MNTAASTALWEIRKAVKPWLEDTSETILFGCSGGADSMAMALALFIEANGVKIIPVVVDHGLQDGSAEITAQTITKLKKIGYTQIESAVAQVTLTDGLEASARRARYQIFNQFIDTYRPNKIVSDESTSQGFTALRISHSDVLAAVFIPRSLDPTPVWH